MRGGSMDKTNIHVKQMDGKVKFSFQARMLPSVLVDYEKPAGDDEACNPVELFLGSLTTCLTMSMLTYLRFKRKKEIYSIDADVSGMKKEKHPKSFTKIEINLNITAVELSMDEAQEALDAAETRLCAVWDMIKGNVEVIPTISIVLV